MIPTTALPRILGVAPRRPILVLTFAQFKLLHSVIMAYPDALESDSPEAQGLMDHGLIVQAGLKNRFKPTAKGVQHAMPNKLKQSSLTAGWPERMPKLPS